MSAEQKYEKFLDSVAQAGEHFDEFIVIVKTSSGNLDWRTSDKTWAMGATERYLHLSHVQDQCNAMKEQS